MNVHDLTNTTKVSTLLKYNYTYMLHVLIFKSLHSNTSTTFDANCIVLHFMQES